jgi:hypothetical protein
MKKPEAVTTIEAHPSAAASMQNRSDTKLQCNGNGLPEKAPFADALR